MPRKLFLLMIVFITASAIEAQTIIKPFKEVGPDKRSDIEINNLIGNPYLKIGGDEWPPLGWGLMGKTKAGGFAEGPHHRAFRLDSVPGEAFVILQSGFMLVPGETYKVSGYIRGENFSGDGGVGLAGDGGWHKFWGFRISPGNVHKDWHYFETTFVFDPVRGNACRFVLYLAKGSKGSVYIERPILEALTPKGLRESKALLRNDDFRERYAAARKTGFKSGPPSSDYRLFWADEFDGDKLDTKKWQCLEMDIYRDSRKTIFSTSRYSRLNGKGQLEMWAESRDGLLYLPFPNTKGLFSTVYGYFECRFNLHTEDYINATFWLQSPAVDFKPGPVKSGHEIDIMECILPSTERLSQTTHWREWDGKNFIPKSGGTVSRHVPGLSMGWHTIALEWTPEHYRFFIDGVESYFLPASSHPISQAPLYILLSFEVHPRLRAKLLEQNFKSSIYSIDYVRVYKKETSPGDQRINDEKSK